MATQTTYAENQDAGLVGALVSGEDFNAFSRTVESAAGIGFGQPAYQGAADRGVIAAPTLTAAAAALGTNTGNGTFGAITAAAPARPGVYTLTIIEPGANVGTFVVADPDGNQIGDGVVATAFAAGGLGFTLADGATDFVAGDSFAITVTAGVFLGITRRNPAVAPSDGDKYAQYREAAIVDMGVIRVKVEEAVTPADPVGWNPATKLWSKGTAASYMYPQLRFDGSASANGTVALRIRKV